MGNRRGNNFNDEDKTGEVISWVVIFILLIAFFPLGLLFLFLKLRGSLGSSSSPKSKDTTSHLIHTNSKYQDAIPVKYKEVSSQPRAAQATTSHAIYSHEAQPAPSAKKGKIRNPLKKKSGRFISAVMLVISILMVAFGLAGAASVLQQFFENAGISWFGIIMSAFLLIGSATTFLSRNVVARRYSRFKNYFAFIGDRGVVPLAELAQVAGVSEKYAIRDLHMMINNGYLYEGTYIDNELECLIISPAEAYKLRMEIKKGFVTDSTASSDTAKDVEQGSNIVALKELREINSLIVDEGISKKVSHLAEVTEKIFKIVDETPEKRNQLRRFISYYLPTTIKLVRSYITLEKQGVKGENIAGAKENIGNILDTLRTGYEQQLDMLFKADALDIAADINVLENLMQQDGLMNSGSGFQVMSR
ncbi:MAG: 5-bromo-4-chloroindolyl phosphate hydrolysis family protein [Oscillospiraceae bacterium]|nr:5-bromo-4-chloroindolyl phosphate hydrolysis family protein [Oscillospiraceae bacterium]